MPKENNIKLPLIVYIHGGGWQKGTKDQGFMALKYFLASGKYIGASIEYRFSQHAIWPAQIDDCKMALEWLRNNAEKYNIDPQRIAVYGASAGGQLVSLLGTSNLVSCVVDFCGPADIYALSLVTDSPLHFGRPDSCESLLIGGLASEKREIANDASPITHVNKDCPPFLIAHGEKDNVVPISIAENFYQKLLSANLKIPPIFVKVPKKGHIDLIINPGKKLLVQMQEFFTRNI